MQIYRPNVTTTHQINNMFLFPLPCVLHVKYKRLGTSWLTWAGFWKEIHQNVSRQLRLSWLKKVRKCWSRRISHRSYQTSPAGWMSRGEGMERLNERYLDGGVGSHKTESIRWTKKDEERCRGLSEKTGIILWALFPFDLIIKLHKWQCKNRHTGCRVGMTDTNVCFCCRSSDHESRWFLLCNWQFDLSRSRISAQSSKWALSYILSLSHIEIVLLASPSC